MCLLHFGTTHVHSESAGSGPSSPELPAGTLPLLVSDPFYPGLRFAQLSLFDSRRLPIFSQPRNSMFSLFSENRTVTPPMQNQNCSAKNHSPVTLITKPNKMATQLLNYISQHTAGLTRSTYKSCSCWAFLHYRALQLQAGHPRWRTVFQAS